ncbi:Bgt-20712 [Blumeria graminis f. sp. tritici]|uniref:Bgt-20712 n=2 Tax=Blumeria graminis f. sp. tritici TaxID=62690 RepID=A0A9X9QFE0_BLUGR|nr:Bgt-20712 [Blumeria graminis f. sp. tritici]
MDTVSTGVKFRIFDKEILRTQLYACQGFGCRSAGDTKNSAVIGWCSGTSSWPNSQARSR